MTDPARYDAVNDQLVECLRGAAVQYRDWKATDDALKAKIDGLKLGPDDMLVVRVSPEYDHDQARRMGEALQRSTGRQVMVMSVDATIEAAPAPKAVAA